MVKIFEKLILKIIKADKRNIPKFHGHKSSGFGNFGIHVWKFSKSLLENHERVRLMYV